jgi:uncharacterized cupredoxin-like copper-binding protein
MKLTTLLAAVLAVTVMAAGNASAQRAQSTRTANAHQTVLLAKVKVAASEFKFVLSQKTARRGVVTFVVTNVGAIPHDFKIKGRKTRTLSHGQSATLRVTFLRKGAYPYTCTIPGHAAAGMKGVFTIT